MSSRIVLLVLLLLLLLLLLLPLTGNAVTWPTGPPPCDDIQDLETCILDGAASGETIEIEADLIPGQFIGIVPGKSFTLRPAEGFAAVFADTSDLFAAGGDTDITIVIEGLTFEGGYITASQGGPGTFDVTIRDNIVRQVQPGLGISVRSGTGPPYGPVLFLVENNVITMDDSMSGGCDALTVGEFRGDGNVGTIRGNRIHLSEDNLGAAIKIFNGSFPLDIDIIGNQISGVNYGEGIAVSQYGDAGSVIARIINNTISGQAGYGDFQGAIPLNVHRGSTDIEVINNTVAYNQRGLRLTGRPDLGATANFVIANNIIAFSEGEGMDIVEFDSTTTNEFNLVFGNGSDSFTPGPGTVMADPLLAASDDLSLQDSSPARGAGSNTRVPMDITEDIAGAPRIVATVEMGAYELPEPSGFAASLGVLVALATLRRSVRAVSLRSCDGSSCAS